MLNGPKNGSLDRRGTNRKREPERAVSPLCHDCRIPSRQRPGAAETMVFFAARSLRENAPYGSADGMGAVPITTRSTRRFFLRPSGVELSAIG